MGDNKNLDKKSDVVNIPKPYLFMSSDLRVIDPEGFEPANLFVDASENEKYQGCIGYIQRVDRKVMFVPIARVDMPTLKQHSQCVLKDQNRVYVFRHIDQSGVVLKPISIKPDDFTVAHDNDDVSGYHKINGDTYDRSGELCGRDNFRYGRNLKLKTAVSRVMFNMTKTFQAFLQNIIDKRKK